MTGPYIDSRSTFVADVTHVQMQADSERQKQGEEITFILNLQDPLAIYKCIQLHTFIAHFAANNTSAKFNERTSLWKQIGHSL